MHHAVKTKCENCAHNEVCSKKDGYLSNIEKIGELDIDGEVTKINIYCDKFINYNAAVLRR